MGCIITHINDSQLMICLANGETQVVKKDSTEAKFWLQKLKDEK